MGETQYVNVDINEGVKTITLNRPDKLNALNTATMEQIERALLESEEDDNVKVIVLRGNGTSFCSGADLKEFQNVKEDIISIQERADLSSRVYNLFHKISKPIIASVHGYVLAGGCGLAMACDLVIASENAKFGYPEIKKGIVAALVMPNLSKIVGTRNALDLLLTGDMLDATTAKEIGMINRIVKNDELEKETNELAKRMSSYGITALRATKQLFYETKDLDLDRSVELAKRENILMRLTKDFQAGIDSF